jgi:hypothetical protein
VKIDERDWTKGNIYILKPGAIFGLSGEDNKRGDCEYMT